MDNLEKRIINAERVIVGLKSMIENSLSNEDREALSKMIKSYFLATKGLGGDFNISASTFIE